MRPDWITMREIKKIIVHCSDSKWGDRDQINEWHKERGWMSPSGISIGYHYVIHNCYPTYFSWKKRRPRIDSDGVLEQGRPVEEIGAHVRGQNSKSIGICLIGTDTFTSVQLNTLKDLVQQLIADHELDISDVYGHRDFSEKECPNISSSWLREIVS